MARPPRHPQKRQLAHAPPQVQKRLRHYRWGVGGELPQTQRQQLGNTTLRHGLQARRRRESTINTPGQDRTGDLQRVRLTS